MCSPSSFLRYVHVHSQSHLIVAVCIDRGTFLDNPDVATLEHPEEHSFHCLLDVPVCKDSGFQVLSEKDPATGLYRPAYRLDDDGNSAVLAVGLATGKKGYCTDCTADDGPEYGFRATIKGTVEESGDGTTAPLLKDVQVLDESVACGGTDEDGTDTDEDGTDEPENGAANIATFSGAVAIYVATAFVL